MPISTNLLSLYGQQWGENLDSINTGVFILEWYPNRNKLLQSSYMTHFIAQGAPWRKLFWKDPIKLFKLGLFSDKTQNIDATGHSKAKYL